MSLNRVMLIGNLGAKPELKYLPSGKANCEMRLATTEKWGKGDEKQEKTEWHRIVCWEKLAENCAQYLDKGRSIYVEGRIQTRTWDDKKTGEKRYMTEIVATNVVFLGGGKNDSSSERKPPTTTRRANDEPGAAKDEFGPPSGSDDDIPF